jgi:cyanophycinase-like exopeptidase
MKPLLIIIIYLSVSQFSIGQSYTSYFTGNVKDTVCTPTGGVCLMGGATENDEAMKWFLKRANGGDVLVLRATGSNGYNSYFYSQLGVKINSVESIVCSNTNVATETYILEKISKAEAIWFAGGDQWKYISYFRNNAIATALNQRIKANIVIGGTSAGMAILGQYYFTAENGTITETEAVANPYNTKCTVDTISFLRIPFLNKVITDTHYDNPTRKRRQMVFMGRLLKDKKIESYGIACEEYTAVCVDEKGIASVYGTPTSDDYAYFLRVNCENNPSVPEICEANIPFEWNRNGSAIKVYSIKGDNTGTGTFNLNDWKTGTNGKWYNWSIKDMNIIETLSNPIQCNPNAIQEIRLNSIAIYPNPTNGNIILQSDFIIDKVEIFNSLGQLVYDIIEKNGIQKLQLHNLNKGFYTIKLYSSSNFVIKPLVVNE